MRPIRACFVSSVSNRYGSELALLETLDVLGERGVECLVVLPREGLICDDLKKRNIPYYVFPYRWWASHPLPIWRSILSSLWNLFIAIYMAIILARWKCDVIVSNTTLISVGAFSAKLLGLPHIWYIHELGVRQLGFSYHLGDKISNWLIDRLCNACIVCSKTASGEFQKFIAPYKLKVVYQPVTVSQGPTDNFLIDHDSQVKCMMIGRVDDGKRQEDAIRALSELKRQGIKAMLYIIGGSDPNYKDFICNIILEHNLDNNVKFVDFVENAFPYLQYADVLLNCSMDEAFGRVTIEAMKSGKPVIGARSGAHKELIREGFNGLLYTPSDYKELAEKIKYLIKHPQKAQQMGSYGRQWALESCDRTSYGDNLLAILRSQIK